MPAYRSTRNWRAWAGTVLEVLVAAIAVIAVGLGSLAAGVEVVADADGAGVMILELVGVDGARVGEGEDRAEMAFATGAEVGGAELAGGVPEEAPLRRAEPGMR